MKEEKNMGNANNLFTFVTTILLIQLLTTIPPSSSLRCLYGSSFALDQVTQVECVNGSCGSVTKMGWRTFLCVGKSLGTCNTYNAATQEYTYCCEGDLCNTQDATDQWAESASHAGKGVEGCAVFVAVGVNLVLLVLYGLG